MDVNEARKVIEALRYGLPPDGYISDFTVGRQEEIEALRAQLREGGTNVLLLNANYGAGKTHLLRFIRDEALRNGWVVSLVSMDSKAGIRFDQLSQIVGAVCRSIEIPNREGKGIRHLLRAFVDSAMTKALDQAFWSKLHNKSKWDRKQHFESEPFYCGIRAWFFADRVVEDYIENWFHFPHMNSDGRARALYSTLIEGMRRFYRDSRPKQYFTRERFDLTRNDELCWAFLRDLHLAARAIGHKGLVLCFDEFEDNLYNLVRGKSMLMAFSNLFELFYGHQYRAHAYFAVTPGFALVCKKLLAHEGLFDYDFSQFDGLKQFEMTPIEQEDLLALCKRIVKAHADAFSWKPSARCLRSISGIVDAFSKDSSQDRIRQCIRHVVKELDQNLEG